MHPFSRLLALLQLIRQITLERLSNLPLRTRIVFPTLEDLPAYLANVRSLGKDFLVPAAALRLRKDKGYAPELIYHDDGSHGVSFMTAVSADPGTNVLIVASVLQLGGFAVCGLEKGILV